MKTKDLMLGDKVQGYLPDTFSIIVGIPNVGRVAIQAERAYMELSIDDIQPIPLTKEIVEKNGFKSTPAFGERALLKETFEIWIDFKEKRHWINIKVPAPIKSELHLHYYEGYVEYVHELQHLLRDCELFVLADNFKV